MHTHGVCVCAKERMAKMVTETNDKRQTTTQANSNNEKIECTGATEERERKK